MLSIRLQRTGRKNEATFRVVLTDSKNASQSGKFLEILGSYNPKSKEMILKDDKIKAWIANGAKPTNTMHNFLVNKKVIDAKKRNVLSKKKPTVAKKDLKKK